MGLTQDSLADYDAEAGRASLHPLLHASACSMAQADAAIWTAMIARHVDHFRRGIGAAYQQAVNEDRGDDAVLALDLIDAERDNVELAQRRLLEPGFPQPDWSAPS